MKIITIKNQKEITRTNKQTKVYQKRFAVTKFPGILLKQCIIRSQVIGIGNSSTHVPFVSNLVFYAQSNIMVISG